MSMCECAQYKDPGTEAANWNSVIIHIAIHTCPFPAVLVCQNIFGEKGLWWRKDKAANVNQLMQAWLQGSEQKTVFSQAGKKECEDLYGG